MYIVHVFVRVKEEYVEEFKTLTIENAKESLNEPGITRFDIVQQHDDPTRFILVEVYRSYEDPAKHKTTDHYTRWRDAVNHMMAEPRFSTKLYNIFPDDEGLL